MKKPDFKSYMRVKQTSDHAKLSASGSERWLGCPGCIRLIDELQSKGKLTARDNIWSVTGTHAHTLLEFLTREDPKWLKSPLSREFREFIGYDENQHASVKVALDFIMEEKRQMEKQGRVELHIEKKVHLEGVGFGTSDIILYQPFGVLHVMDYKNGKSIVEPEDNHQGLYYANAAADLFGWDVSEIWITIIQPNANHKRGPIRTWKTNTKRVEDAGMVFKAGAKRTEAKDAPLVRNDKWCWWCPARPACPLHLEEKQTKIMERFQRGGRE